MSWFICRVRSTVYTAGLFLGMAVCLSPLGCDSTANLSSDLATNGGETNQEPDRDTLPLTVSETADYSSFRVNATALDENQNHWEFEVTSDTEDAGELRFIWNISNEAELSGIKQRYSFDRPGVHRVQVTAYGSDNEVVFVRRVDIEVPGISDSPVAIAGDDQTVEENELAFLYGEESISPDGHELSYLWTQTFGPPVLLIDPDQAIASFVTPVLDADAELEFRLTVSNGDLHGEDMVRFTVLDGVSISDDGLAAASTTTGSTQNSGGSGGSGGGGGSAPCSLGDTDNDGLNDCSDECPGDPMKIATGLCGCGVEDLDSDTNGTMDCLEQQASQYQALNASAGPDATIVVGGSATLQGGSSGGRLPHSYRWTPVTALSNPNALRPVANPTVTTTYTLTVTDALGRTDTDTARITVVPALVANAGPNVTVPPGGSATLNGGASGGSSPYTYSWSPQSGLNNPNVAQPVATPNSTRTYTLTVTDAQSRTATDTVLVTVTSSTFAANAGIDVTISAGSTTTLNGSASGGTTPYTYRWTPTTGLNNPNIDRPSASPATTTTYTLTVTDAQARTATDTVVVTVTSSTFAANAGNDVTIPAGSTTTLNGSASGGTTPYTYRWTPTTGLNNPNIDRPTASPATTTTYTLTVTDSQARTATDFVVVTIQTSGAALSVSTTSLSFGSSTTNQTFAVWNSGSGTLNYTVSDNAAWLSTSPNSGSSTGEQDTINVTVSRTGLADGLYQGQITVTPSSGALVTVLVTLTVGTGGGTMNTALRTTGVAPLGVMFDAVGAASGVLQPPVVNGRADYASFTYQWIFGDNPQARWSTDNRIKNEAFGQVAGHVFESPGTFTVTLTVTEPNGSPHAYQQQIVVQDPEVVYANSSNATAERTYYLATEGNDANNGSFNQPFRTWDFARGRLFASNGPRRLLLKRGQTFTHVATFVIRDRQGPFTIGAYGTGVNPIVHHNGTSGEVLTLEATTTNVRVMDVDFTGSAVGYAMRPGTETVVLRSRFTNFGNAISTSDLFGNRARNFFVDCQILGSDRYGIYYNFGQHVAVLGTLIENVNAEHLLRCYLTHSVISHNIFRGGHTNKHQLKFVGYFPTGNPERAPGTATETVEHSIISDNRFENPGAVSWMITIGPVDQGKDQRIENLLFERNFMRAGPNTVAMLYGNNRYVTVRNNVFDGTGGPAGGVSAVRLAQRGIEPAPIGYNVFNNTMYRSDSGDLVGVDINSVAQNTQVKNNLVSAPNSSVMTGGGQGLIADHNVLSGNPAFTNPAAGDFSLRTGSVAIDAGANLSSVLFDYQGGQRPYDGNGTGGPQWDAGAFEFRPTATGNTPPSVDAGVAQQVTLPANSVNLDGTVTDDGLPTPPSAVTVTWSKVNGAGNVTFGNANAADTSATFSAAGAYTLRLTASDNALTASDDVVVTVNAASTVGTERMGINVAKVYGWGSQIPFVDAFKQSRPWISANADGTSSNTGVVVPVDALGYPLEIPYSNGIDPPQIVRTTMLDVDSGTYPAGTYTLTSSVCLPFIAAS
ncbi:MAG: PKD domain-containing protein [Planctomycetota bacterium]